MVEGLLYSRADVPLNTIQTDKQSSSRTNKSLKVINASQSQRMNWGGGMRRKRVMGSDMVPIAKGYFAKIGKIGNAYNAKFLCLIRFP